MNLELQLSYPGIILNENFRQYNDKFIQLFGDLLVNYRSNSNISEANNFVQFMSNRLK